MTGRSKGYAFVQYAHPLKIKQLLLTITNRYKRSDDAKMALEQMEGFELAGRTVRI